MKKLLFLILCFTGFSSFASQRGGCPSYESEYGQNYFQDLNQLPILQMVKNDLEESNLLGNIVYLPKENQIDYLYYQNGNIFAKTPYQNFKKNGPQEFFYSNQNLLISIPYQNDIINGMVQAFYIDGSTKLKVTYLNGKKTGTGLMFYPNGNLALKETYQNGLIQGIQYQYYPDATVQSILSFNNGVLNGPSKLYYENGDILATLIFENGVLVQNICYTPLGEQSSLNQIALFKLKYGMRPINCFVMSESQNY